MMQRYSVCDIICLLVKDQTELPYIMLRLERAHVEFTLAKYTLTVESQLHSLQLIDKQNGYFYKYVKRINEMLSLYLFSMPSS